MFGRRPSASSYQCCCRQAPAASSCHVQVDPAPKCTTARRPAPGRCSPGPEPPERKRRAATSLAAARRVSDLGTPSVGVARASVVFVGRCLYRAAVLEPARQATAAAVSPSSGVVRRRRAKEKVAGWTSPVFAVATRRTTHRACQQLLLAADLLGPTPVIDNRLGS